MQYRPGTFHSADLAAASEDNERNSVRDPHAGRTSTWWSYRSPGWSRAASSAIVHAGDKVALGDTYGLIRFGSRLDTYLPAGSQVLVEPGQRALAGETVLAAAAVIKPRIRSRRRSADPAQRDHRAGDLRRPDLDQVRARRPAARSRWP